MPKKLCVSFAYQFHTCWQKESLEDLICQLSMASECYLVPLITALLSSIPSQYGNSHPLHQTPSHTDVLNSAPCCAEFRQLTESNSRTRNCQIYWVNLRKYCCWKNVGSLKLLSAWCSPWGCTRKLEQLTASRTSCKLCNGHVGLSLFFTSKVAITMLPVNWKRPTLTDDYLK